MYKKKTTTKDSQDTMKPNNNESISILPLSICYSEKRGSALSPLFSASCFTKATGFCLLKRCRCLVFFTFLLVCHFWVWFFFGNILDRLGENYIRPKKLLVYIYFFILSWIIRNLPGICY